jgi:hypothetical protein
MFRGNIKESDGNIPFVSNWYKKIFLCGQHRHVKIFTEQHDEMQVDGQDTRQRNGANEKRAHHEYVITSLLLP